MEFTRMLKSLMAVMMAAQVRQEFRTKFGVDNVLELLIMLGVAFVVFLYQVHALSQDIEGGRC